MDFDREIQIVSKIVRGSSLTMIRPLIAITAMISTFSLGKMYEFKFRPDKYGTQPVIPLNEFPQGLAGPDWSETNFVMDEAIAKRAGVSEYINNLYSKDENTVWFYVGYYDGRKIEGLHQPEICFPGSGWKQINKTIEQLNITNLRDVRFNALEFEKNGVHRYTLYTFYYKGKFEPDQSVIERGRAFSDRHFAIITISANISESRDASRTLIEELSDSLLKQVIKQLPESKTN